MASATQPRMLRQTTPPAAKVVEARDATDRIDYDAWLLPPVALGKLDRRLQALSAASGPVAFCAFAGAAIRFFI